MKIKTNLRAAATGTFGAVGGGVYAMAPTGGCTYQITCSIGTAANTDTCGFSTGYCSGKTDTCICFGGR